MPIGSSSPVPVVIPTPSSAASAPPNQQVIIPSEAALVSEITQILETGSRTGSQLGTLLLAKWPNYRKAVAPLTLKDFIATRMAGSVQIEQRDDMVAWLNGTAPLPLTPRKAGNPQPDSGFPQLDPKAWQLLVNPLAQGSDSVFGTGVGKLMIARDTPGQGWHRIAPVSPDELHSIAQSFVQGLEAAGATSPAEIKALQTPLNPPVSAHALLGFIRAVNGLADRTQQQRFWALRAQECRRILRRNFANAGVTLRTGFVAAPDQTTAAAVTPVPVVPGPPTSDGATLAAAAVAVTGSPLQMLTMDEKVKLLKLIANLAG